MTKRMLEKNGHTVESASNGSLGLARLMETHGTDADFDLVLCDFQMPVMDGFETVRRYRAFERDAKALHAGAQPPLAPASAHRVDMAIVGMSANSDIASMTLAREVGMNAVMPKPFSMANLQSMLQLFRNE
jgi:CheY-like chemotaxis protein